MRRLLTIGIALCLAGCPPKRPKTALDPNVDYDANSGNDAKRSGAQPLKANTPKTDDVSAQNLDRTDWYTIDLRGKPGVLTTEIHWDSDNSDLMIDVFDTLGAQIAASPVRGKGAKAKKLLTQIDKIGTYYIRVSAPSKVDATVYTLEAKWDQPPEPPPAPPPAPPVAATVEAPPPTRRRQPRPEPVERTGGETIQGRIVAAYREGAGLTLQLDKGADAGVKPGMTGVVLAGSSGDDPLEGGSFRIISVLSGTKSVGKTALMSIGKNTRVSISLGR